MKKSEHEKAATGKDEAPATAGGGFEDALAQLEAAIRDLESGQLTLDDSLQRYESGLAAWKQCHKFLEEARQRIEIIRKTADGEHAVEPFGETPG